MGFHEVQFPPAISFGSSGGPGFSTSVVTTDSGAEERIARWNVPRHQFDISYGIRDKADIAAVITFYMARQGAASGFRYKDWDDFTSAADHIGAHAFGDQPLGSGDGSTVNFQLVKKYTSGGVVRTRNITKPVSGTVLIGKNGSNLASGWSVNDTNGVVTLTTPPVEDDVLTAGFQFDVPVRFGEEADQLLNTRIDSFDTRSIPSIPVVEIIDPTEVQDEFFFGGAKAHGSIAADVTITLGQGRVHSFNPTISGVKIFLPDPATLSLGGPQFFLVNLAANTLSIVTNLGTLLFTLSATTTLQLWLGLDSSGNRIWKAQ